MWQVPRSTLSEVGCLERGGVFLPGPFRRSDNPSASSVSGSGPASSWSEIGWEYGKGRSAAGNRASKAVVLKGQGGGVRRVYLPFDSLPFVCTPFA